MCFERTLPTKKDRIGIRQAAVARVCALLCESNQEHVSLGEDMSILACVFVDVHSYIS